MAGHSSDEAREGSTRVVTAVAGNAMLQSGVSQVPRGTLRRAAGRPPCNVLTSVLPRPLYAGSIDRKVGA